MRGSVSFSAGRLNGLQPSYIDYCCQRGYGKKCDKRHQYPRGSPCFNDRGHIDARAQSQEPAHLLDPLCPSRKAAPLAYLLHRPCPSQADNAYPLKTYHNKETKSAKHMREQHQCIETHCKLSLLLFPLGNTGSFFRLQQPKLPRSQQFLQRLNKRMRRLVLRMAPKLSGNLIKRYQFLYPGSDLRVPRLQQEWCREHQWLHRFHLRFDLRYFVVRLAGATTASGRVDETTAFFHKGS